MIFLYSVLTVLLVSLTIAGVIEQRRHYRNLRSIPFRVLVNGIRGKSSVTRLTAGALRGGRLRVVAKTTGTAARFIYPDASEEPVYRKFNIANIEEQVGIVSRAAAERPDALVMECMAVQPALQEINQTKLIQSTIGILTNVREDHLDEMGPSLTDVAKSLSRSMPVGGTCFTAEVELLDVLRQEAAKRRCRLIAVNPGDVSDAEMAPFTWFTFKDNVALALGVAEELGISRSDALEGMWQAPPDPGVLSVDTYYVSGTAIQFANVFAANDPRSTVENARELAARGQIQPPYYALINCRPDRVERNLQMGEIVPQLDVRKAVLVGDPTRSAREGIPAQWNGEVLNLGGSTRDVDEIWRSLVTAAAAEPENRACVLGIGNIHGQGENLLEYMERLGDLR